MQMIASRIIPFLDVQSLAPGNALEALFRDEKGFILYLSDGAATRGSAGRGIVLELMKSKGLPDARSTQDHRLFHNDRFDRTPARNYRN
jgi:hypothetical protein